MHAVWQAGRMALGSLPLGDLLRQAYHAAAGPQRLYAAALRAGAGPRGAVEALRISEAALRAAGQHAGGVPGRTNAVRHFLWQALLTARLDRSTAEAIAAAQESGTERRRDSEVDHRNNTVGQEHGAAHAAELRSVPLADAVQRLVPVALAKWDSGELVWIRPHRP